MRRRQAIDRLPEAARGRPPVLAVRAVALAGSGDADGARTTVAALAAHPQLAREDIDAVLPALARLPEHGTEQALLRAARSARLGHAGDAAPSRRDRERRRPLRRGPGVAREGGGAGRARRGAADRAGTRGVQGRRRQGRARLPGPRARPGADQRGRALPLRHRLRRAEPRRRGLRVAGQGGGARTGRSRRQLRDGRGVAAPARSLGGAAVFRGLRAAAARRSARTLCARRGQVSQPAPRRGPHRPGRGGDRSADGGGRALLPGADRPAAAGSRDGAARDRRRACAPTRRMPTAGPSAG